MVLDGIKSRKSRVGTGMVIWGRYCGVYSAKRLAFKTGGNSESCPSGGSWRLADKWHWEFHCSGLGDLLSSGAKL